VFHARKVAGATESLTYGLRCLLTIIFIRLSVTLIEVKVKKEVILKSEAAMTDQINRAKGEAEAILAVAEATAKSIELVASSIGKTGGEKAVALKLAEQYIQAFSNLAKETNTILLPENTGGTGAMVAQALSVFNSIQKQVAADKETKVFTKP
jgi:regulator of protease activity HflC (stomatin/prohibitin superfamily)